MIAKNKRKFIDKFPYKSTICFNKQYNKIIESYYIEEWLHNNVGSYNKNYIIECTIESNTYCFKNEEHFINFTLTWM